MQSAASVMRVPQLRAAAMAATRARPYQASCCLVSAMRVRVQSTVVLSRACRSRWVACHPRSTART
eukprot:10651019-Lingulodinium_polyedra.AAC.1